MSNANVPVVSGEFHIEVTAQDPVNQEDFDRLTRRIDSFIDAMDVGLFPHAHLRSRLPAMAQPIVVHRVFMADSVPEYSFSVLAGMLYQFDRAISPLAKLVAWERATPTRDLLMTSAVPPPLPTRLPGPITIEVSERWTTPPLEIEIEFANDIVDQSERARFLAELITWSELIQGGYSASGERGDAATAHVETRFLRPGLLHFQTPQWWASTACFVPLLWLLQRWNQLQTIRQVSINAG